MSRSRATPGQLGYIERLAAEAGHGSGWLYPPTDAPPADEDQERLARVATPGEMAAGRVVGCPRIGALARLSPESAGAVIRELRFERAMMRR